MHFPEQSWIINTLQIQNGFEKLPPSQFLFVHFTVQHCTVLPGPFLWHEIYGSLQKINK